MYKIDRRGGGWGGSKNRILGQTLLPIRPKKKNFILKFFREEFPDADGIYTGYIPKRKLKF